MKNRQAASITEMTVTGVLLWFNAEGMKFILTHVHLLSVLLSIDELAYNDNNAI